jgi:hypothetical protein
MAGKRQRTTFGKIQRERARMDKAAEKRARRLARKRGSDAAETAASASIRWGDEQAENHQAQRKQG